VQLRRKLRGLALPVALFAAWFLTTSYGVVDERLVPSPRAVAATFETWASGPRSSLRWDSGTLLDHIGASGKRVLIGFGIAAVVGTALGALIGWYSAARETLDPFLQWLRPIPVTAWLPFVTLLFGIRETSAITLIALGCFFPILLNTTAGVRGTREVLVRAALMLGAPKRQLLRRVAIPAALPNVVTGLRLGVGLAWVLVIVAEFVGVESGLGYALWMAFQYSRQDIVIADIIILGALGLLSDRIIRAIATRTIHWSKEF
jgi:NitT/TauT family transport system permease protein